MQNKIEHHKNTAVDTFQRLSDIRSVGQLVFVVIVLLVSWSGIKSIQSNYGLQKQITVIKQQNEVQQLENNNSQLQNEYYNSNQYLELSARQNFALAAPGEKEIVVPVSVAQKYTVSVPSFTDDADTVAVPTNQSNPIAWANFFLHRQVN